MSNKEDDRNPMHSIGYGRGDDESRSVYSFIPGKDKTLEAMDSVSKPLTVKDVISRLIEVNAGAWATIPQSMKDAMIERPQDFQFINPVSDTGRQLPNILYNGVVLRHGGHGWVLDKIVR